MQELHHQNEHEDYFRILTTLLQLMEKKIKVELKIVGGKRIPLENIVKNYSRFGEE